MNENSGKLRILRKLAEWKPVITLVKKLDSKSFQDVYYKVSSQVYSKSVAVFATVVLVENFHVPMLFLKLCFIKILILQICALCLPFQSGLVSIYLQIFPFKFLFVKWEVLIHFLLVSFFCLNSKKTFFFNFFS